NVQRPTDIRPKMRLVVVGFCRRNSRDRERRGIERRSVIRKIKYSVRLVDIESASADSSNRNRTAASAETSSSAQRSAEAAASLLLKALAEFLNPIFNILFVAIAEVLRTSLRPRNAHRFRRRVCSSPIQRKTVKFRPTRVSVCAPIGTRAARKCGKRSIANQSLQPSSHGRSGHIGSLGLLLLS